MDRIAEKINEINELMETIAFRRFKHSFPKVKHLGVHPGHFMIIKFIDEECGIKQKELVEKTGREKATITKTLQRLEKREFIKRVIEDNDKRSSIIYLTEKGKKIKQTFKKLHKENINQLINILSDEDLDKMIDILNKIKTGLN